MVRAPLLWPLAWPGLQVAHARHEHQDGAPEAGEAALGLPVRNVGGSITSDPQRATSSGASFPQKGPTNSGTGAPIAEGNKRMKTRVGTQDYVRIRQGNPDIESKG